MPVKQLAHALVLLVLHRADGGEVFVNPEQITSLRVAAGVLKNSMVGSVNCVIHLTDTKVVAVMETCDSIKQYLER